jgi:hypothetical protein
VNPWDDPDFDPQTGVFRLPIRDILDLHSVPPRDAQAVVEEYLREAHALGLPALRIIHGKGIGAQRAMVRRVLDRTEFVTHYEDAPLEAGGWGATIVSLQSQPASITGEKPLPNADLLHLATQWEAIRSEAATLTAGLTRDQFHWRSEPGQWSIAQCLEHLIQVDRLYAEGIEAGIDRGRREGIRAPGPFQMGWLESWFVRLTEPPPRWRIPAPRAFRPTPSTAAPVVAPAQILQQFEDSTRRLASLTANADGLDLVRIRVASPVSSRIRFSLLAALSLCAAHDRRHLYQARQVVAKAHASGAW